MDLNSEMEFGRVIRIEQGKVLDTNLYAPELMWSNGHIEMSPEGWVLLDGYSGQYRYGGPLMHESEYIGGRMEQDILARDGIYVALVCYDLDEATEDETPDRGWAVAHLPE